MANKKHIEAAYDHIYLSKGGHEEAEFTSKTDVNVVFDFPEKTPFANGAMFPVKAGTTVPSGPLKPDVALGRYRYHVNPMGGGPGADPTIIVTN
jgi:hypothetical protein